MKKIIIAALLVFSVIGIGKVGVAEEESYAIHIMKYKLSENQNFTSDMLHDGTLVDKVTDNSGKELAPLGNVEYTITRMEAIPHKGSATTYQEATGDQSFVKTIVTDSNGKAELTGLAKGIYRVSETASEFVTSPMEPVLLALPMKNATGYLTDVYLYPKSNMAFPDLPKTGTETPATQDKLLNTSGNIGDYQMLIYMIISMVIAGMIGLIISKRREQA